MVLSAKNMVSFINGSFPKPGSSSTQLLLAWDRLNNVVFFLDPPLCMQRNSCHHLGSWFCLRCLDGLEDRFSVPPLIFHENLSELSRDRRRLKIVKIGGAQELLNMLVYAEDELTQKEALKALNAISKSALHNAGAISVKMSIPDTSVDAEIGTFKIFFELLKRFRDSGCDLPS
ncbi:P60-like protein [Gossypium australe]|uniref:P60-like protein n=1 Tax=Gossypium australe TaxID=47621 RepID=A0A5B6WJN3_9ROSI|nr:P60-like protein [Gossypium australe]